MGNIDTTYDIIEEPNTSNIPLPMIQLHPKGKPYGIMIEFKLKCNVPNGEGVYPIYDLRVGDKSPWYLGVDIYGEELKFSLYTFLRHVKDNKSMYDTLFTLKFSSESNNHMTVLKGSKWGGCVRLELFADNIHCQRMENIKFKEIKKFHIWGFIQFDDQNKIPITF